MSWVQILHKEKSVAYPAIQGYGGNVEVLAVIDGIWEVKYEGPAPIGMSIQAAIRDKVQDIKVVELLQALVYCKFDRQLL